MKKILGILRRFFDVQLTPDEVVHVTLVQIRAM